MTRILFSLACVGLISASVVTAQGMPSKPDRSVGAVGFVLISSLQR
ncbi:hypothetical protein J2R99_000167 [Rhodopseudomonas julia]|uniref:Uncharacterized protein n=1 Tax=Rhodopseudomonas julia TaxID=200617 RepID=A0ABU0C1C2_9BRAD|nr:hypothetical protein [Rhodopseudomonas julia]MDQ0324318.1 hypothetical protein [Rhodopseudomonas julia]